MNRLLQWWRAVRSRTDFRLALGFSLVFALSAAVLYLVTFLTLLGALNQAQTRQLEARLLGLYAQYTTGGIRRLVDEIDSRTLLDEDPFLVRIATLENETQMLVYPPMWESFALERSLANRDPESGGVFLLRSPDKNYVLEVATLRLPDRYLLQVGVSTENRDRLLGLFRNHFVLILGALVLTSFVAGTFVARRALAPMSKLHRTVRSVVETGDLSARITPHGGNDDMDRLVVLVNRMLGNIQTLVGGMAGTLDTVAHDLRTPMTRLRGIAEVALSSDSSEPQVYRRALEACVSESERILKLLNTIMDISEVESGMLRLALEDLDLSALLRDVCELYGFSADARSIRLDVQTPSAPGPRVEGDPVRLRQAFGNLMDNAIKFSPSGSVVRVGLTASDDAAVVTIEDAGPGIPPEELPRVWERLFRGSAAGNSAGMGLGLSLVRAVIEAHGGTVELSSNAGTTAEVRLPLI